MPLRRFFGALSLLTVIFLASCQPAAVSTPIPTPIIWEIQFTPTVSWLGAIFNDCMQTQPHASIVVHETPAQAIDPDAVDFAFQWGAPIEAPGYAAVIGWDELAIIVHPDNPVDSLALAQVIEIYSGASRSWSLFTPFPPPGAGRIRLWGYAAGNDVQNGFNALTGGPLQSDTLLHLAPDPQAMIEAVAGDAAAIGFIPRHLLDKRVRSVQLTTPGEAELRQPILALSAAEPQGDRRAWLLCVQDELARQ